MAANTQEPLEKLPFLWWKRHSGLKVEMNHFYAWGVGLFDEAYTGGAPLSARS
ncbi:MAG: hypothetical protein GX111_09445 [Clostridiales bacterium]|nr:hypothetical protein [Clostridiales bacterium]